MKKSNLPYLLIGILLVWSLILSIVLANTIDNNKNAQEVNEYVVDGFSTDFTKIIDDNKNSIVTINCNGATSSGFVYKQVDSKVYILTSYHGVSSGIIKVSFGSVFSTYGTIIGKDIYTDLAVVEVDSAYSIDSLVMGDATALNDGEFVVCIGTPISSDYAGAVELGMISNNNLVIENSIEVDNVESTYYLDVIQLSSNLKPGYSGSPVLNMNGEVVGMMTMSLDEDLNFAITSNEIRIIAENIIAGNEYVKYHTGIKGTFINEMPTYVQSSLNLPITLLDGLYVEKVMPFSLASIAQINSGDVILSINGVAITDLNSYLSVLYTKADALEIKVLRDNSNLTLTVHIND